MTETLLTIALDYLTHRRVQTGGPEHFVYYADETRRWYRVKDSDVVELGRRLLKSRDAYSQWAADTNAEEMPEGWTPGE